jgi:hypothetical protein
MRAAVQCLPVRLTLALLAAGAATGCHVFEPSPNPVEVNGVVSTTFSVMVGGEVDVYFQTIGPGSYAVPPTLSGSTIEFLEVTPGENDPGGVTQLFHFKGVATGMTVITFQHTCECTPALTSSSYSVTDTVTVH